MSIIKINRDEPERILLTEVLPYEVPIIFSNEGFYKVLVDGVNVPSVIKKIWEPKEKCTIPFSYQIKRTQFTHRKLYLIHPSVQKDFISFYQKYDAIIIDLCRRSPFSLRAPTKVAARFYMKDSFDDQINTYEGGQEDDGVETDTPQANASSYFVYNKYEFLYKFFESYEYHDLEKKFPNLLIFDISKCFNSIYTHTIAWAVKDKKYAKENKGGHSKVKGFESIFDVLMENANDKETNGIVIGPEISRIFAEIILQRIDLNVIQKLESDPQPLRAEYDYAVRRYVDDYYVFAKNIGDQERIFTRFQKELEEYKLFINESKTQKISVPYITDITIAKICIKKLVREWLSQFLYHELSENNSVPPTDESDANINKTFQLKNIAWPQRFSSKMIMDIKATIKSQDVDYSCVSTIILIEIRTWINKLINTKEMNDYAKKDPIVVRNLFWVVLDVMFFVYSMDTRVRCTYVVSSTIVQLNRFLGKKPNELAEDTRKKIFDESIRLLKKVYNSEQGLTVEVLNLLIAIRDLGNAYLIDADKLSELFEFNSMIEGAGYYSLNYFQITTILFYVKSASQYRHIRKKIESGVLAHFASEKKPFMKAELTFLFFDLMSCPYISKKTKEKLCEIAFFVENGRKPNISELRPLVKFASSTVWFINWSKKVDLVKLLMKRELHPVYR